MTNHQKIGHQITLILELLFSLVILMLVVFQIIVEVEFLHTIMSSQCRRDTLYLFPILIMLFVDCNCDEFVVRIIFNVKLNSVKVKFFTQRYGIRHNEVKL